MVNIMGTFQLSRLQNTAAIISCNYVREIKHKFLHWPAITMIAIHYHRDDNTINSNLPAIIFRSQITGLVLVSRLTLRAIIAAIIQNSDYFWR